MQDKIKNLKEDAITFHTTGRPGKLEITPTKPLNTQRDLSLAYSPGVAEPCIIINKDPETAYIPLFQTGPLKKELCQDTSSQRVEN